VTSWVVRWRLTFAGVHWLDSGRAWRAQSVQGTCPVIRLTGGQAAEVRRAPGRDKFGDTELVKVGESDRVVIQWASRGLDFQPANDFGETATLVTVAFMPKTDLRVEYRDRLKIDGHTYQVVGERAWDFPHPMTGRDFRLLHGAG
jgi:hypothetical protein